MTNLTSPVQFWPVMRQVPAHALLAEISPHQTFTQLLQGNVPATVRHIGLMSHNGRIASATLGIALGRCFLAGALDGVPAGFSPPAHMDVDDDWDEEGQSAVQA